MDSSAVAGRQSRAVWGCQVANLGLLLVPETVPQMRPAVRSVYALFLAAAIPCHPAMSIEASVPLQHTEPYGCGAKLFIQLIVRLRSTLCPLRPRALLRYSRLRLLPGVMAQDVPAPRMV